MREAQDSETTQMCAESEAKDVKIKQMQQRVNEFKQQLLEEISKHEKIQQSLNSKITQVQQEQANLVKDHESRVTALQTELQTLKQDS